MRVIAIAMVMVAVAGSAHAQPRAGRTPVEPASYVETQIDGYWIGAEALDGGAVAIGSRGAIAPFEALEIGGGWGWRAYGLHGSDGLGAFVRAGLVPWTLWIGTGAAWTDGAIGARLGASMGPRLVGNAEADAGGEAWSLGLAVCAAQAWRFVELRIDADVAWMNRLAPSIAAGGALSVLGGDRSAPVRPLATIEVRGSNDLGLSPRLRLGAWITVDRRWGVRIEAYATTPTDREGFRIGLALALLLLRAGG